MNRRWPLVNTSNRPSGYRFTTDSTSTVQPVFIIPPSFASTIPNSVPAASASPTISLYRSSNTWSGIALPGHTTSCSGNRGRRPAMMLLLPFPIAVYQDPMDSLNGKVVIVTGASEGNGAHLAAVLQKRGAHLSLIARNENRLAAIAAPDDLVVPGDITRDSVRSALIAQTV